MQALTILLYLALLVDLAPQLALVALTILPAIVASSFAFSQRTRSAQVAIRDAASALTSVAEEGPSAIALVKVFAREPFERRRFGEATGETLRARMRSIRVRALFTPVIDILATIGLALVVWFGAHAVWSGYLTPGGLVAFVSYLGALYAPIQPLSRLSGAVQCARVGAERVAEVLDEDQSLVERRGARPLSTVRGLVQFNQVTVGYDPRQPVLMGVDLSIARGEIVALVGLSGAGKTTVVSLLLNYYDVDGDALTIDGQDVRHFEPASVRQQIAAVLQEPMLFQTSVRENLRYGRLDASEAEIETAARVAQADQFIRQLPDGYDTQVGSRGSRLSGGQRQRLAIARAVLKHAPIVVLDEATSALDPETEGAVLRGLRTSLANSAVLVIAHRISTVRLADRILVLQDGRIVECGTHDALLAEHGQYFRFDAAQPGIA